MKLWGGRFDGEIDSVAHNYNASLSFDIRLYDEDITASIVWAWGLVGAGVLTPPEAERIVEALEVVRVEIREGFRVQEVEQGPRGERAHQPLDTSAGANDGSLSGHAARVMLATPALRVSERVAARAGARQRAHRPRTRTI